MPFAPKGLHLGRHAAGRLVIGAPPERPRVSSLADFLKRRSLSFGIYNMLLCLRVCPDPLCLLM